MPGLPHEKQISDHPAPSRLLAGPRQPIWTPGCCTTEPCPKFVTGTGISCCTHSPNSPGAFHLQTTRSEQLLASRLRTRKLSTAAVVCGTTDRHVCATIIMPWFEVSAGGLKLQSGSQVSAFQTAFPDILLSRATGCVAVTKIRNGCTPERKSNVRGHRTDAFYGSFQPVDRSPFGTIHKSETQVFNS